ncbi:g6f-like isoform X2 [Corythoichthys intestinalis]|uniref:g6f-like isoform X2 n=1 Tax=Corythoichthys intestinalis TaxID=161448 RepID=UPI0025A5E3EC|nr:g6f-like isoform X2 [Corythoichthys intestinalis]
MARIFIIFLAIPSLFLHFYCVDASSIQGIRNNWDEIVVGREHRATTLECIHTEVRAGVKIIWMAKAFGADDWKLVLSASELEEFSGSAAKPSMRLADPNFLDTGNFSLLLQPFLDDAGFYMCLIEQVGKKIKEKIILLAIITVSSIPASPIPRKSTLRLMANIIPEVITSVISWESPDRTSLKTVLKPNSGFVTKLPQVTDNDAGSYKCTVHLHGMDNATKFTFALDITVNAVSEASFTRIQHGPPTFKGIQAGTSFHLTCPDIRGDYVFLNWQDPKTSKFKLLYTHDSWRGKTWINPESHDLQLAGTPSNPEAGSFSFIHTPGLKDGGVYICDVLSNDSILSQRTLLIVLKVMGLHLGTKLQLECLYNEASQVQYAKWEYQNKSRLLRSKSSRPGNVTTTLPLPVTTDMEGNYTCTLQFKNGQTISARHSVKKQEIVPVPSSSLHLLLLTLLLLVLLVAAATAVLLWRQKRISRRGETENIYENPEDVRQALPPGSVYMDLKPRQVDVYKELER